MRCELMTPERRLFSGEAEMVVARSPRGEFGVMNGHAPLLAALVPGEVRVKTAEGEHGFVVAAGLLRVGTDGVTILAQDAVPREEIDLARVRARIAEIGEGDPTELAFLRAQEKVHA